MPDLALREVFCAGQARDRPADAGIDRQAFLAAVAEATSCAAWSAPTRPTSSRPRRWRRCARARRPASHVAFREISAGLTLSMDECMRMEFRILNRMLEGNDFYEGIRAVIIDKGDTPEWRPGDAGSRSTTLTIDALFRAARRAGAQAVSDRRAQSAVVRAIDGRDHLRLVPPRDRRPTACCSACSTGSG